MWCGTNPGGLFLSKNGGDSWVLNDPLRNRPERAEWFGGGFDTPGIDSICVDPRDSNHPTIGVSCGDIWQTRDGGRSFDLLNNGLPQGHAYDLVYRHGLDVDERGERLAMGSTTGHLWISEDGGDSWTLAAGNLPPIACVRFC